MRRNQKKRLWILSLIGANVGGFMAFTASFLMNSNTQHETVLANLYFGLYGFIATFLSIQLMWRLMFHRKPETKQRGLRYGALAGILAVFFMMTIMSFHYSLPIKRAEDLITLVYVPFFMSVFAFIFGGFLAPILGAVLGYYFTRNNYGNKPDRDRVRVNEN